MNDEYFQSLLTKAKQRQSSPSVNPQRRQELIVPVSKAEHVVHPHHSQKLIVTKAGHFDVLETEAPCLQSQALPVATSAPTMSQIIGFTQIDSVSMPYFVRNGESLISVKVAEERLLSQFPPELPPHLKESLIQSHYLTPGEASFLNASAMDKAPYVYSTRDLAVKLSEFKNFHSQVKELFGTNGCEECFWLQVDNAIVPCVNSKNERFLSVEVLRATTSFLRDLSDNRIPKITWSDRETSKALNQLCKEGNVNFRFKARTPLVPVKVLWEMFGQRPTIQHIEKRDPLGTAKYVKFPSDTDPPPKDPRETDPGTSPRPKHLVSIIKQAPNRPTKPKQVGNTAEKPEVMDLTGDGVYPALLHPDEITRQCQTVMKPRGTDEKAHNPPWSSDGKQPKNVGKATMMQRRPADTALKHVTERNDKERTLKALSDLSEFVQKSAHEVVSFPSPKLAKEMLAAPVLTGTCQRENNQGYKKEFRSALDGGQNPAVRRGIPVKRKGGISKLGEIVEKRKRQSIANAEITSKPPPEKQRSLSTETMSDLSPTSDASDKSRRLTLRAEMVVVLEELNGKRLPCLVSSDPHFGTLKRVTIYHLHKLLFSHLSQDDLIRILETVMRARLIYPPPDAVSLMMLPENTMLVGLGVARQFCTLMKKMENEDQPFDLSRTTGRRDSVDELIEKLKQQGVAGVSGTVLSKVPILTNADGTKSLASLHHISKILFPGVSSSTLRTIVRDKLKIYICEANEEIAKRLGLPSDDVTLIDLSATRRVFYDLSFLVHHI